MNAPSVFASFGEALSFLPIPRRRVREKVVLAAFLDPGSAQGVDERPKRFRQFRRSP